MRALLIAACVAAAPAWALDAPMAIGLHLASAHSEPGYQSLNPGVYLRWRSGLTLGAYHNSEGRSSAYAAWTIADRADRFGLTAGVVTGYKRGVMPLLVPSMRISGAGGYSTRLSLLAPPGGAAAIHLSIERRF